MTKHKNVALDELRILAALMVLGVHTGQKVGLGDAAAVGAQGVQLFFVLSGYLAAASLSRHPEPLPYYQRRIRRILPLYWLVLVLRWLFDAVRYLRRRQCSPAVWPRRAVRAGLPAVLCIFADVAAQ